MSSGPVGGAPLLRSALFVPAHRTDLLEKARRSGADAIVLDLEDSVLPQRRADARCVVRGCTAGPADGAAWCVRVGAVSTADHLADLDAAVGPGLLAVMLAKTDGPEDVVRVAGELERRERAAGLPVGSVLIWPLLESARAVQRSAAIAEASPRVAYLGGGTSDGGDLAHSLGFTWTPGGLETLYLRSKVLLDARAAGVAHPVTGVVTELSDLDVIRGFAEQSRQLGYAGMLALNPRQVQVANEAFGRSPARESDAAAVLRALAAAEAAGDGAARYGGRMVDAAMRASAVSALAAPSPGQARGPGSAP